MSGLASLPAFAGLGAGFALMTGSGMTLAGLLGSITATTGGTCGGLLLSLF